MLALRLSLIPELLALASLTLSSPQPPEMSAASRVVAAPTVMGMVTFDMGTHTASLSLDIKDGKGKSHCSRIGWAESNDGNFGPIQVLQSQDCAGYCKAPEENYTDTETYTKSQFLFVAEIATYWDGKCKENREDWVWSSVWQPGKKDPVSVALYQR